MFRTVYANASDIALCQKCPALFGYKIHMNEKNAWQVGIKGNGSYYGSMFHKNIARPFFEAAANPRNPLHAEAVRAVSAGRPELEGFIREKIFIPFMETHSWEYSPEQIMAAARGVSVWAQAMAEFFAEIPSLRTKPTQSMKVVFRKPEQKLQAEYTFSAEGSLVVTGCYDALMFNPDRAEARLFEFKGYAKSDIAVPLSQSLIYAWLIWQYSGIVPSVEIIYLDEEDRKPVVFDPVSVKGMIDAGLPGLFYAAFNTITLRRMPEIMRDKVLCKVCRFSNSCVSDWSAKFRKQGSADAVGTFRKRAGASLVNVCVFFLAAIIITTQAFFFSTSSTQTLAEEAKSMTRRFSMGQKLELALTALESRDLPIIANPASAEAAYSIFSVIGTNIVSSSIGERAYLSFDKVAKVWSDDSRTVFIYDLNYKLINANGTYNKALNSDPWNDVPMPKRLFPPMQPDSHGHYFLVRVLGPAQGIGKKLMYQVLTRRKVYDVSNPMHYYEVKPLTFQEVWYE